MTLTSCSGERLHFIERIISPDFIWRQLSSIMFLREAISSSAII
jgi:hypothetical protein